MIFLLLWLYLSGSSSVFAAPQVSIFNYPNMVTVGETFPISFNVFSTDIGLTYHYKIVGDSNTDISIFPACALRYDDCLNLITDVATISATSYAQINIPLAKNFLKIRLAQSDKHSTTFDSQFIYISSILPTPTLTPSPPITTPLISPTPSFNPFLIVNEIMANPQNDQDEWIEIHNASSSSSLINGLCFYDATNHSRCLPKNLTINPDEYYIYAFSSGFLNNNGDTLSFQNEVITYPNSPSSYSYSRQNNSSWCFADSSQGFSNHNCLSLENHQSAPSIITPTPVLSLQIVPLTLIPGDDFVLVFSLNSEDEYSLRLLSPFTSQYASFSDYKNGYSWLTLSLSLPKKITPGTYPLSFRLKKDSNSHLVNYELGQLTVINPPTPTIEEILGVSTNSSQVITISPTLSISSPSSTIRQISRDINYFSWPFLFVGSILLLSPILFPKLFSA